MRQENLMSQASVPSLSRVVITGIGVVAPNGIGKEAFWHSCISGISGIRQITRFDASALPARIAGEVVDFDPIQCGLTEDEALHMDRGTQFALAAAQLALDDANIAHTLNERERERMGVYMGSAMACAEEGERIWRMATDSGTHPCILDDSAQLPANLFITHASASCIAAHAQLYGPCMVIATGCSAGTDAIGQAFWAIQEGRVERMLAGGSDAALSPLSLDVFCVMGALSTNFNAEPQRASRPYDQKRDGFVMAEGAAVLLLEERELALARGAHIYAEILAFSSNNNAHHMATLPPDGLPLQQLFTHTLLEADITQQHVDYINSHGSSTLPNDRAETAAYKAVFGEYAYTIPISATKSLIGHTQGAASAIEAVVTALVLERQCIPPTLNLEQNDPLCDLDYVPNIARVARVNVALTHSSGFGGVNSALIMARPEWIEQHEK
jgi:3-oxoacyl-(acyl-carrier-protein) synthase